MLQKKTQSFTYANKERHLSTRNFRKHINVCKNTFQTNLIVTWAVNLKMLSKCHMRKKFVLDPCQINAV